MFSVSRCSETEMDVSSLLTSAAINTAVCVAFFSLYSVLRKQPSLLSVYFGQRLSQVRLKRHDPFCFERLVPSASWIVKAWEASEDELYAIGGVDAVVFLRAVVFSVRILTVAGIICLFLVLPLNYNFGIEMEHKQFPDEPLNVFTIGNVKEGSRWLWAHCLALYIITCCACILLYFEYKNITKMRLAYITSSVSHPSHFTVLVRAIPWSREEAYSDTLTKFFTNYYSSSYLLHQMIYQSGAVQKLMSDAEKMYKILRTTGMEQTCGSKFIRCGFCGGTNAASFKILSIEPESSKGRSSFDGSDTRKKECGAALVFFRTRYAALVASEVLQAPNPMSWVTDSAPEPRDVYWSNLCVPYRLLWIRKIAVLVASILFVIFFLIPVVFTQSLVHFEKLKKIFPFLRDIGQRKFVEQVITGYLPSVIFMIFLYFVPPLMMVFSTLEGSISRSSRKRSTCIKVTYFVIWNVFFANILTETAIDHYQISIMKLGDPKNIPNLLAKAVPSSATFFMTYVLTSGWASLSVELIQPFPLVCNLFYRFILQNKDETTYGTYTFPYHTEVPRVLLFGLLGFTCSTLAPLILPFLLVYFVLAYFVYRNQILNVYVTKYQTGGLYWPVVHNTTIFSLVLTQIIALGVFGIKESSVALSFTIPLIVCTLLFNEYCRQRFHPVFRKTPAKIIIEMDRQDEHCGRMEEIHQKLQSSYCQFASRSNGLQKTVEQNSHACELDNTEIGNICMHEDLEDVTPGKRTIRLPGSLVGRAHLELGEMHNK
ncbi:CSC1-like protein RXW8 isoform X1 [Primulina eburnea]|uniref:CSC1-like protein RXW8 isoform X1 n=2 Tax=Primulina eburnea TaxID=1245227 RepID=UPI003C6C7D4D